ncbi:MAG: RNA polymerase sigma factor [Planctomycetota bacterium]
MFEGLAKRYADPLLGFFFRRTRDLQTSEDLLQETFVRVFRKARTFRGEGSFRGWMYTIALNLLRSSHSGKGDEMGGDKEALEAVPNGRGGPETGPQAKELGEAIRKAVTGLPPRQRDVFILRQYQELPFDDVAAALGITSGAARAHMHRALETLRRQLRFLDL